jgi:multiple antibiotic resistance protein
MPEYLNSFIHLVFIGFVALFPVVNPVGTAFIVNPYFTSLSREERLSAVKKITFYAFLICTVTLLLGHWILELFGISIPIIQLAGGVMICKIGWESLASDNEAADTTPVTQNDEVNSEHLSAIEGKLFFPITFPMTTGAGTIAVLFTLSANGADKSINNYMLNIAALLISVIGMCILIFVFFANTKRLINYIGSSNEKIVNRLMAFLIFCVGLQIASGGIINLIKTNFG